MSEPLGPRSTVADRLLSALELMVVAWLVLRPEPRRGSPPEETWWRA